jgi:hypothetical protein
MNDDDDWHSENDELVTCPECKADVYLDLNDDRCPKCGYWFLEADRDKMWQQVDGGKSLFLKVVALIVLLALVLPLLLVLLG